MRELLNITKALSDSNRVRALMFLRDGELCLCQIIEMLGLSYSTVSKHMTILYQAGLVESRKEGRWNYYRLSGPGAPRQIKGIIRWVKDSLGDSPEISVDAKKLKSVLKVSREELCCNFKKVKKSIS